MGGWCPFKREMTMRAVGVLFVTCAVVLAAVSARSGADEKPKGMPDLKAATRLEIDYGGQGKRFNVKKAEELTAVLQAIEAKRTGPEQYGGGAVLRVAFVFKGGKKMVTQFMTRPDQLDVPYGGQIYLKDRKFYDALCELISKREGKKVDPLKDAGLPDE